MPELRFKNIADTIVSLLRNAATAVRTYTFPDKDGTVAMTSDLPDVSGLVPSTRQVNGHALSSDVTITKGDVGLGLVPNLSFSGSNTGDQDLSSLVTKEDWVTLAFGSTTNWDTGSKQSPLGKVTATGSLTINMTNVKSGGEGWLKLITNTASAITLTFDTDFTNKRTGALGEEVFTTYTFQASTGKEYLLRYVADGTTLHWVIFDFGVDTTASPMVSLRVASISWPNNSILPVTWTSEDFDNTNIYSIGTNPSRLPISGFGNKWVTVTGYIDFASNSTGIRRIWCYINGVSAASIGINYWQINGSSTNSTTLGFSFQVPCVGGDYLEIEPYQNSGGALNITGSVQYKIEGR